MSLISMLSASNFEKVAMPFGMALTNDEASVSYTCSAGIYSATYSSQEGLLVWTEDGVVHDFSGDVFAQMTSSYTVCIYEKDGLMRGAFDAVCIFAITPRSKDIEQLRAAIIQSVHERTVH